MSTQGCGVAFVPTAHRGGPELRAIAAFASPLSAYVRWVQDVAKAHSESAGWDHAAYVKLGGVFVVRKHEIEYLASAKDGDELQLVTWIESWTAVTSERRTRIERAGQVLARCTTTWAFVSLEGKPRRIPAEVLAAFGG